MAFCGKCGKEIDDEAVVCVHCGCPVTSQSSQEAKAETQGLSDKQKKIIAFAVVILAGLLAAFWFFVESYDPTSGYEEEQKLKQEEIARLAREHNNANILVMPGRFISQEEATHTVEAFLSTSFEGGRHQRRIDKIPL